MQWFVPDAPLCWANMVDMIWRSWWKFFARNATQLTEWLAHWRRLDSLAIGAIFLPNLPTSWDERRGSVSKRGTDSWTYSGVTQLAARTKGWVWGPAGHYR